MKTFTVRYTVEKTARVSSKSLRVAWIAAQEHLNKTHPEGAILLSVTEGNDDNDHRRPQWNSARFEDQLEPGDG